MVVPMNVFLPMPLGGSGVSYTCGAIAEGLANDDLAVTVVTPRATRGPAPSIHVIEILPRCARYLPYRWLRPFASRRLEGTFLSQVNRVRSQTSAAYIWPDVTLGTIHALKRNNAVVFREMINCPRETAKIILDQAYERLGLNPRHMITTQSAIAEKKALEAVDYIFCPSPMVHASLVQIGIPPSKLLEASYGWDPARLARSDKQLGRSSGLNALFVGAICVRKGIHLLLDYWAKSGVKGRLVLAGQMEPIIKEKCANLLNRQDVVVLKFVDNVGALYRSADLFLLPSLEEGSPLVTYEACGSGLPVLASPMGAGGVVRHNCEGFVIDPYDGAAWIDSIQKIAADFELRGKMAKAAAKRAESFIWSSVAARRRRQVLDIVRP